MTQPSGPNAAAIHAISEHYCIQRDPRRTAIVIGDITGECARRLLEGRSLPGDSLEYRVIGEVRTGSLTRAELLDAAAGLVEEIALYDMNGRG